MKIKVSEATERQLDWMVNQIEECCDDPHTPLFSSNWAQGGPIIEQEKICLWSEGYDWEAKIQIGVGEWVETWGPTPLIAAMRCYVARKLGDEVEIPEELE